MEHLLNGLGLAISPFILSWLLTKLAIVVMPRLGFCAISNNRSSHQGVVPTAGGVGFVLSISIGINILYSMGQMETSLYVGLLGSCVFTAVVGLIDDRIGLGPVIKLACHGLAAIWAIGWLGIADIQIFGWAITSWWLAAALFFVGAVWLTNLFNFMDGTDGLAAIQAILVLLFFPFVADHHSLGVLLIVLLALLGFLPHNWPKAKIFMGDVGSGFLGILFACLILASSSLAVPIWCWVILLTTFWVDTTYTLFAKKLNGVSLSQAHNQHLYQKLAQKFGSHKKLLFLNSAIVVLWLYPLAYTAFLWPAWGLAISLVAAIPTLAMCLRFKAGKI
jgi:Fuc2NAc and GlcNAc transferase